MTIELSKASESRSPPWRSFLLRQLAPEQGPTSLAVMRITVCSVWLLSSTVHEATRWAGLPESVRVPPFGMGWIFSLLPPTPASAKALHALVLGAAAMGLVGFLSRYALAILALAGCYLMAIPQLSGVVFHDHHLVWLAALLAASPCGDALSVDAWLHRRAGGAAPAPSRAYGLPIRAAWLLIGMIFLFPGLWKLRESGLEWIFSDNLRNQMRWKWAQMPELLPRLRVDRHPLILRAGALAVVLFELSFLPMIFWRPARPIYLFFALLFHAATHYFMGIRFASLWLCYTVFLDWEAARARLRRRRPREEDRGRGLRAPALAAAALGLSVFAFGAAGKMQAWPFACYPTFQWIAGDRMPALALELAYPDGRVREIPRRWLIEERGNQRYWGLAWSLSGAMEGITGQGAETGRLEGLWRELARSPRVRERAAGAFELRFVTGRMLVDPEEPAAPLSERRILHRIAL